jgi:DNA-binding MarR family transcriptional regulator
MYMHIYKVNACLQNRSIADARLFDVTCICMYHADPMNLQSLPCYCATLRQAARAATSWYEEALAGSGIRATQFTILQVLKTVPDLQTTELGKLIGIDQTTATRTLALMKKSKLVGDSTGTDRRERRWRLTPLGEATYRRILPKWESAQAAVERRLGRAEALALKKFAFHAASELIAPTSRVRVIR